MGSRGSSKSFGRFDKYWGYPCDGKTSVGLPREGGGGRYVPSLSLSETGKSFFS